jgi:hypothetical protein
MFKTVIIAIYEKFNLSMKDSVARRLTDSLQKGESLRLQDSTGSAFGVLRGITPVLQPVLVHADRTPSILMVMRGIVGVSAQNAPIVSQLRYGDALSLIGDKGGVLSISVCSDETGYTLPLLLLDPAVTPPLSTVNLTALQDYVGQITSTYWSAEPINGTTDGFGLASSGEFMPRPEMLEKGLVSGMIVLSHGLLSLIGNHANKVAETIGYKKWQAGKVNAFPEARASSECSTGNTYSFASGGSEYC